jgi:hypothetical protein
MANSRYRAGSHIACAIRSGKNLEPNQQIRLTGKSPKSCQSPFKKIFCFSEIANQVHIFTIPSHQEGRYAIVTFAGRAAVDA